MVLDNASPQNSPAMGTISEQGDNEPFVPQNPEFPIPKYQPRAVRPETITRPNALHMMLYMGQNGWRRKVNLEINHRIGSMQSIAARRLTQDEIDAVATQSSLRVYRERLGIPLGLAATYISVNRSLRTWNPWKVYYHREGKWVRPLAGTKALLDMVRLDSASAGNLVLMVGSRCFFWTLAGMTVCTIYAGLREALALRADRRMFSFMKETKDQDPEMKKKRLMDAYKREKIDMMREERAKREEKQVGGDELSPQQKEQEPVASVSVSVPSNWGSSSPSPSPSSSSWPQPIAEQPQSRDFFDDQDDASPTAPEYRAAERRKQGVSVWAQIRQQNMSGSDQSQGQNSWERASGSDAGSSLKPDWTRQREREQSQAEFDKLIESERNASSDSWSGGKAW